MLVKVFGVKPELRTSGFAQRLVRRLVRDGFREEGIRVGFSSIPIRRNSEPGPLRVLVTGLDVHGRERTITRSVGSECELYYKEIGEAWYGFEDPALPGQPGESEGRPR